MKRSLPGVHDGAEHTDACAERDAKRPRTEERTVDWWADTNSDVRRLIYDALPPIAQRALALTCTENHTEARNFGICLMNPLDNVWPDAYAAFLRHPEYRSIARRIVSARRHVEEIENIAAEHGDMAQLLFWDRTGYPVRWEVVIKKIILGGHVDAFNAYVAIHGTPIDNLAEIAIKSNNLAMLDAFVAHACNVDWNSVACLYAALGVKNPAIYDAYVKLRTSPVTMDIIFHDQVQDNVIGSIHVDTLRHAFPPAPYERRSRILDVGIKLSSADLVHYGLDCYGNDDPDTVDAAISEGSRHITIVTYRNENTIILSGSYKEMATLLQIWTRQGAFDPPTNMIDLTDIRTPVLDNLVQITIPVRHRPGALVFAPVRDLLDALCHHIHSGDALTEVQKLQAAGVGIDWMKLCRECMTDFTVRIARATGTQFTPDAVALGLALDSSVNVLRDVVQSFDDPEWAKKAMLTTRMRNMLIEKSKNIVNEEQYKMLAALLGDDCAPWLSVERTVKILRHRKESDATAFIEDLLALAPSTEYGNLTIQILEEATLHPNTAGIKLAAVLDGGSKQNKRSKRILRAVPHVVNLVAADRIDIIKEVRHLMPVHMWTAAVLEEAMRRNAVKCLKYMIESGAQPTCAHFITAATANAMDVVRFLIHSPPVDAEYLDSNGLFTWPTIRRLFINDAVGALVAIIEARKWPLGSGDELGLAIGKRPYFYELLVKHGYAVSKTDTEMYDVYKQYMARTTWSHLDRSAKEWKRMAAGSC